MYNAYCYIITAKSNLHVGTSSEELTPIDNIIQRDPLTKLPNINESSLKGAIKEYIYYKEQSKAHPNDENAGAKLLKTIFGSVPDAMIEELDTLLKKKNNNSHEEGSEEEKLRSLKSSQKGQVLFDDARVLCLPIRSNNGYFYRATSDVVLRDFIDKLELYKLNSEDIRVLKEYLESLDDNFNEPLIFDDAAVELEYVGTASKLDNSDLKEILRALIGERVAILPHKEFEKHASRLPIIDRNKLDNGESKNLWFEEVVPRESKFYFVLNVPSEKITIDKQIETLYDKFHKHLLSGTFIQIGASATIGYGRCIIEHYLNNKGESND